MKRQIKKEKIQQLSPSKLRSEDEIISSWKGEIDKPLVSINCITYNHEPYIEDALIGFLRQKTDFPIEILIHDDASSDGTTNIIRKYHELYPRLIKPIYQSENQRSQGVRNIPYNASRAQGEYIAICEGDDYWITSSKLQKQISLLRESENINIVFSSAYCMKNDFDISEICSYKLSESDLSVVKARTILALGGGAMPTASIVHRTQVLSDINRFIKFCPVGDVVIQSLGSIPNGALFLEEATVVYRKGIEGSWSSAQKRTNSISRLRHVLDVDLFYRKLSSEYFCYKAVINRKRVKNLVDWVKISFKTFLSKILLFKS